jgi:hypothetical protein
MNTQRFDEITKSLSNRNFRSSMHKGKAVGSGRSRRALLAGMAGSLLAAYGLPRAVNADCTPAPWDWGDCLEELLSDPTDILVCVATGGASCAAELTYDGVAYSVEAIGDGAEYVLSGPGGALVSTAVALSFFGIPVDPAAIAIGDVVLNSVTKFRALSVAEENEAKTVFGSSLPPRAKIILTNLPGLSGRQWTWYNQVADQYVVNLGDLYSDPLGNDHKPILMHELTHVWQIHHGGAFLVWGCDEIWLELKNYISNQYDPGDLGRDWSDYNYEQQGNIVETWVRDDCPHRAGYGDCADLFPYIKDNIRRGDPSAPYPVIASSQSPLIVEEQPTAAAEDQRPTGTGKIEIHRALCPPGADAPYFEDCHHQGQDGIRYGLDGPDGLSTTGTTAITTSELVTTPGPGIVVFDTLAAGHYYLSDLDAQRGDGDVYVYCADHSDRTDDGRFLADFRGSATTGIEVEVPGSAYVICDWYANVT